MIGSHQFPPAGSDDEVFRRGGPASSESDFFSEFFGQLSPDVSARVAAAAAASHDAAADTDAVREEEVESPATKVTTKSGGASMSGTKRKEAAGGSSDHHQKRKRNRTTEMHNMTERRRRDKIKGKLKALQDLIPNSHKLDRASLLDEAIAYVKTLQMQVQLMSNSGLCHSPCLSPSAGACLLPHSPAACLHMPFSPFSRMGMGYGMGISGMGCPVGPPLLSISSPRPSTSYVQIPGFSTIPSFCPLSQGPFPMPEFAAAMTTSIPSPPILQAGLFSSHIVDGGSQEAVTTQVLVFLVLTLSRVTSPHILPHPVLFFSSSSRLDDSED